MQKTAKPRLYRDPPGGAKLLGVNHTNLNPNFKEFCVQNLGSVVKVCALVAEW